MLCFIKTLLLSWRNDISVQLEREKLSEEDSNLRLLTNTTEIHGYKICDKLQRKCEKQETIKKGNQDGGVSIDLLRNYCYFKAKSKQNLILYYSNREEKRIKQSLEEAQLFQSLRETLNLEFG